MKLIVFGATGRTGRQVVEQALAMGYQVTAIARNPSAIITDYRQLEIIQGDVLQPATLRGRRPEGESDQVPGWRIKLLVNDV